MLLDNFRLLVGIDLGTSNTLAAVAGKGIVYNEPTLVARLKKKFGGKGTILAFGKKAKEMLGKEPKQMEIIAPLSGGVIADFDATVSLFSHIVEQLNELPSRFPRFLKPLAVIGVPSGITTVEQRAVKSAAYEAGCRKVFLVEEPMAAAFGINLPTSKAAGNLLVDIGGGTTEITVLSLGGIVLDRCLPLGGKKMDEAVVNFVRMKYGVLIGLPTAEKTKIAIGSVLAEKGKEKEIIIKGREMESGLPKTVKITEAEIREAIAPIIQEIIANLSETLEETPPELTADISKRGIVLTGGVSQLAGLEKMINERTKMPVWTPDEPQLSVVKGCVKLAENRKILGKITILK